MSKSRAEKIGEELFWSATILLLGGFAVAEEKLILGASLIILGLTWVGFVFRELIFHKGEPDDKRKLYILKNGAK